MLTRELVGVKGGGVQVATGHQITEGLQSRPVLGRRLLGCHRFGEKLIAQGRLVDIAEK